MEKFDPRYYTLDRLSPVSLVNIDNSLKWFLHHYDVTDWPIDCFQLLKKIQEKGRIHLDIQRVADFSSSFEASTLYFPEYEMNLPFMIPAGATGRLIHGRNGE